MFEKVNPGNRTEHLRTRLTMHEMKTLSEAAQRTRRTISEFARIGVIDAANLALAGAPTAVSPLPPALGELGEHARQLFDVTRRITSNLTQLGDHAQRLGEKFFLPGSLCQLVGGIEVMRGQVREVGMTCKAGEMPESVAVEALKRLDVPGAQVNALAHELNEGGQPAAGAWGRALCALRDVLT